MTKALILVADGSEEIEFVTPYDVLVRAGVDVVSAGVNLKEPSHATLSRHIRIIPDHPTLTSVPTATAHDHFDILILPGGGPGAATFASSDAVLELIHNFRAAGKYVAFICAGTTALVASVEKHGGEGKGGEVAVTSHPSVKAEIKGKGWRYSEERVVVDGRIVTSRGPGTALLFAYTIVELLLGKEKREEVAGPMIPPASL